MAPTRKKPKLNQEVETENNYFKPQAPLEFVSTGCTMLDCVLGGGFALGRIGNIVGDRSTAKTALATEVIINFLRQYPNGSAFYRETEAAYDIDYSISMGLDIDRVNFGNPKEPVTTVEEFAKDLSNFIKKQTALNTPGVYVLDSLDALSDDAEMERDIGEGTFGMAKAKAMSILFRTVARRLEQTKILLLIVSQVRENINSSFGEKYRRSGGKALDFFASQVLWLAHIKTLKRTVRKVERPYGVMIKAKTKKNKVALPFRECDFPFIFNYGVDDLTSNLEWLKNVDALESHQLHDISTSKLSIEEYKDLHEKSSVAVKEVWSEIEESFKPKFGKYK